jgi:hypothetical protein
VSSRQWKITEDQKFCQTHVICSQDKWSTLTRNSLSFLIKYRDVLGTVKNFPQLAFNIFQGSQSSHEGLFAGPNAVMDLVFGSLLDALTDLRCVLIIRSCKQESETERGLHQDEFVRSNQDFERSDMLLVN